MTRTGWTIENIPDQTGRTFVVTGANSGLGLETTRALASRGARVLMACRNVEHGRQVREALSESITTGQIEVEQLDLGDLATVENFADRLAERWHSVDGLINNAGVMALPKNATVDGFDRQIGVNHLGHFALTGRLLPLLRAGDGGRIVTVSSDMHRFGKMRFDDLHGEVRHRRWEAYAQSKLANLLFTYELARKVTEAGAPLLSLAAHPGYADTNLQRQAARFRGKNGRIWGAARLLAQSAADGALP
ncbi:MAG: oxidoreductase, partial [Acidimicrobiia bacterium]|nr:oxidoreductase [Acidimicrobiia bacterium]